MSFSAHLEGFDLPDILQVISVSKQSGVATIIHSGASAKIVFKHGRVIYACSDTKSRLGYSLVRRGVISEEDLERALEVQKNRKDRMPLASVLVKLGVLFPEVLEKETRDHIDSVFADVLTWKGGKFFFEPQLMPDSSTILKEGLQIESLLINAAAARDTSEPMDPEIFDFWPYREIEAQSTVK